MIYIVIKKINLKGGIKIKMKKMTMTFGIVNQDGDLYIINNILM